MIYILFLAVTLVIVALAFYQWQYFMIFSPTYYRKDTLDEHYELLVIHTDDKAVLEGVVYTPPHFSATILFFGGRSHDAVGLIKRLALSYPHARIITFNYRSYGKSTGVLSEKTIFQDGLLLAQKVQKNYGDFYLLGFSLGSSVASYVASKHKTQGVFLVGVYDSVAAIAKKKFGLNLSLFLRYKFENTKFAKEIDAPTYVFVSNSDTTTYIENAREIKKHYKNLVYYIELDNLHHKEILWDSEVVHKINEELE